MKTVLQGLFRFMKKTLLYLEKKMCYNFMKSIGKYAEDKRKDERKGK